VCVLALIDPKMTVSLLTELKNKAKGKTTQLHHGTLLKVK